MPGGIWTRLQKHVNRETREGWNRELAAGTIPPIKSPEQGAATSVLVATSPDLHGIGGRYFEDCAEAEVLPEGVEGRTGVRAVGPRAVRGRAPLGPLDRDARRARGSHRSAAMTASATRPASAWSSGAPLSSSR